MSTNPLIIEKVSPFNVPITVEKLIDAVNQKGWHCPAAAEAIHGASDEAFEIVKSVIGPF